MAFLFFTPFSNHFLMWPLGLTFLSTLKSEALQRELTVVDGEILRFILHHKILLEKLIRFELVEITIKIEYFKHSFI